MSVLKKLNEARKRFHASQLKKTGHNKFAGYHYFELADFLVPALTIFDELGLSSVISFTAETATMTITDLDDEASKVVITSPMSSAQLKACHEVQNLGAVQTYLRRYLWVAALEIVEHDAIDASEGADKKAQQPQRNANGTLKGPGVIKATDGAIDAIKDPVRRQELDELAGEIVSLYQEGHELAAIGAFYSLPEQEEKLYVWARLAGESAIRTFLKKNSPNQQKEAA